jgi:hypothetical protein
VRSTARPVGGPAQLCLNSRGLIASPISLTPLTGFRHEPELLRPGARRRRLQIGSRRWYGRVKVAAMGAEVAPVDLDSSQASQVESPSTISVSLDGRKRQLVVCSGFAITNWESHGHFNPLDVRIRLNVQATALLGWAAVAGLAGVSSDDNDSGNRSRTSLVERR